MSDEHKYIINPKDLASTSWDRAKLMQDPSMILCREMNENDVWKNSPNFMVSNARVLFVKNYNDLRRVILVEFQIATERGDIVSDWLMLDADKTVMGNGSYAKICTSACVKYINISTSMFLRLRKRDQKELAIANYLTDNVGWASHLVYPIEDSQGFMRNAISYVNKIYIFNDGVITTELLFRMATLARKKTEEFARIKMAESEEEVVRLNDRIKMLRRISGE